MREYLELSRSLRFDPGENGDLICVQLILILLFLLAFEKDPGADVYMKGTGDG